MKEGVELGEEYLAAPGEMVAGLRAMELLNREYPWALNLGRTYAS